MRKAEFDNTLTLSFSVKDRLASVRWYAEHLACTQLYDAAELGWTEMATPVPGVTIGFGDAMEVSNGGCVPVFGVRDLDAARASLESEGVKFAGETIRHDGMVKLATFHDPDGHALMLAESLAEG